jgi:hypothetical protein
MHKTTGTPGLYTPDDIEEDWITEGQLFMPGRPAR